MDRKTLLHVAKTARLDLTQDEMQEFLPQLSEILDAFSKLQEVDTDDVPVMFHPVQTKNAMREDKAGDCLTQEEALKNAGHTKKGYIKGPRVVE